MNIRPGFLLLTPEDGARVVAALSVAEDADLRAIAARLQDAGARSSQAKPQPKGRRASELWEVYSTARMSPSGHDEDIGAVAPMTSVAAFLAQEKDPFPGTEGEPGHNGRASKEQMEDRVEVAAFCILAQPNGTTSDVKALLAAKWGVGDVQVSSIFKRAAERLRGQARPDDDLRAKVVAHGWNVYDAALRQKRPQAAVGALDGIARNAGLVKAGVEVNIFEHPQFVTASTRVLETVDGALGAVDDLVARVSERLGRPVPRDVAAALLSEAQAMVDEKMAAALGRPQLVEGQGESV
jgi:hypothetical protein